MASSYSLEQYVANLRAITAQETDPVRITDRVAPLAKKFAQAPGWLRPEHRECDVEQGFGVHLLYEEPNHDLAVFLISWLPNRGTTPHNHKTWAVVVGIEGQEQEVNYDRLDDGSKRGYADLQRGGAQVMTAGDIARCYPSTFTASGTSVRIFRCRCTPMAGTSTTPAAPNSTRRASARSPTSSRSPMTRMREPRPRKAAGQRRAQ
jgi:predicted metal-dependent enzyme (double-stranded beta helix superfamily)